MPDEYVYNPTEWKNGDVITAEKLNNLEAGVTHIFNKSEEIKVIEISSYDNSSAERVMEIYQQVQSALSNGQLPILIESTSEFVNDEVVNLFYIYEGYDYNSAESTINYYFAPSKPYIPDDDTSTQRLLMILFPDDFNVMYLSPGNISA